MPDLCFVCQQNCSRKVCFQCSCRAHPLCWQEYQKNYPKHHCPVCKTDNVVKPYNTRSKFYDQELVNQCIDTLKNSINPRECILAELSILVSQVRITSNRNCKLKLLELIMIWLLAGKNYSESTNLITYHSFNMILSQKLRSFIDDGWAKASLWHKELFNVSL